MRAALEALRAELRPIDLAAGAIAVAWILELAITLHDRTVWRDGYAAGYAGASVHVGERALEEHTA